MESFSDEEEARIERISNYYFTLKELMLYSETLGEKNIFLPPLNELRQSQDRIMRVLAKKFEPVQSEYNRIDSILELDKASSNFVYSYYSKL